MKDIISDLIGLAILLFVSMLIYQGKMSFIWEGIAGYCVGGVFFFVSDEGIAKGLQRLIGKMVNKVGKEDKPE